MKVKSLEELKIAVSGGSYPDFPKVMEWEEWIREEFEDDDALDRIEYEKRSFSDGSSVDYICIMHIFTNLSSIGSNGVIGIDRKVEAQPMHIKAVDNRIVITIDL